MTSLINISVWQYIVLPVLKWPFRKPVEDMEELNESKRRLSLNESEVSEVSDVIELEAIFEAKEQVPISSTFELG